MKIKKATLFTLVAISFFSLKCIVVNGQNEKEHDFNLVILNATESFSDACNEMIENAVMVNWKGDGVCKPNDLLNLIDNTIKEIDGEYDPKDFIESIYFNSSIPYLGDGYDKGLFLSLGDKGLSAFSSTTSFKDFVAAYTGKDVGDLDLRFDNQNKTSERKEIESYYRRMQFIFNKTTLIDYYDPEYKPGCDSKVLVTLRVRKFDYPVIDWEIKIKTEINCSCVEESQPVKMGVYEYSATSTGLLTYDKITFGPPKNPKLEILELECCKNERALGDSGASLDDNEGEDISIGGQESENISYPNQFLEVGLGVATAEDEETEFCVAAGIFFEIAEMWTGPLYVGARAKIQTSSLSSQDFSSTRFSIGPAVEHQVQIGETKNKWINGVQGAYVFGNREGSGFKDDISGFTAALYSGLDVALNHNITIGVIVPLIEYSSLIFKAEEGDYENKVNTTGFNFNKGSVSLNLRINLDKQ